MFITISAIALLLLKPYLKKKLVSRTGVKVNINSNYIGREAYVLEEINPNKKRGKVIIAGAGKKATTKSGEIIREGAFVTILESNQAELTVEEV